MRAASTSLLEAEESAEEIEAAAGGLRSPLEGSPEPQRAKAEVGELSGGEEGEDEDGEEEADVEDEEDEEEEGAIPIPPRITMPGKGMLRLLGAGLNLAVRAEETREAATDAIAAMYRRANTELDAEAILLASALLESVQVAA